MGTEKAAMQRDRILVAAQRCFIEHGFHGASMASIAATAEMSAGLIYRYFAGKNAIVIAIIQRQLALVRRDMCEGGEPCDLAAALADNYGKRDGKRAQCISPALFLEMSAEATRDEHIAAALREFDEAVRADLVRWLGTPERALLMQCLFEGLRVREAREPGLDRKQLKDALDLLMPALGGPGRDGG